MGDDETKVGKRNSMHDMPSLGDVPRQPPESWDRRDTTMSSAEGGAAARDNVSGKVTLTGTRIGEGLAREILYRRFTTYGARIQTEYPFRIDDVLCTLDGYDPEKRVGYIYVSHADADVVTDMDVDTEFGLHELMRQGKTSVFIVHDTNVVSTEDLVLHIDQFLGSLPT